MKQRFRSYEIASESEQFVLSTVGVNSKTGEETVYTKGHFNSLEQLFKRIAHLEGHMQDDLRGYLNEFREVNKQLSELLNKQQ